MNGFGLFKGMDGSAMKAVILPDSDMAEASQFSPMEIRFMANGVME